jgi:hypothetical protein
MARIQCLNESNQPVSLADIAAWDGEGGGLTPGMYLFHINEVEQTTAQSSGKPQLHLKMTVVQGADSEAHNGQDFQDWRPLAGKKGALGRLKSLLDACAIQLDGNGGFDDQELVNREFWAEAFEDDAPNPSAEDPGRTKKVTRLRKEMAVEGQEAATPPPPPAAPAPKAPATPAAPARATPPAAPAAVGKPKLPVPGRKA